MRVEIAGHVVKTIQAGGVRQRFVPDVIPAQRIRQSRGPAAATTSPSRAQPAALPGINRFVNRVTTDLDAVTAGLSPPFNPGPVEGNVNRIKMPKRQMYGRANFDPLRKRVLQAH